MPAQLIAFAGRAFGKVALPAAPATPQDENALRKIFILLRGQTGHDFTGYKPSTIQRRIARRMAVHQIETKADYVAYLQQTPTEVEALFRDLLIGVTNFFRDPVAFGELEGKIIPGLFEGQPAGSTIRIWCPGCSTASSRMRWKCRPSRADGIPCASSPTGLLKMTTRMLQGLGYAVLAANSPEAAIRLAKVHAGAIHLLMTDVVMPEMNGRDLAKHLIAFMPQLKVLLMSGYTADIISRQGKLDAGLHFIQKPFSVDALAVKVRAALAGKEGTSGDQG